jgi:hypothetical protein
MGISGPTRTRTWTYPYPKLAGSLQGVLAGYGCRVNIFFVFFFFLSSFTHFTVMNSFITLFYNNIY